MESRYALREVEVAIGYDCRRLDDGRKAVFRHTLFHKRVRRDFMERREMTAVMGYSYLALASLASNPRMDADVSQEIVSDSRLSLIRQVFPYVEMQKKSRKDMSYDDYQDYFDEIDRIEAEAKGAGRPSGGLEGNASNDIMSQAK